MAAITKGAKALIESGQFVPCYICLNAYGERLETKRYCAKCDQGFCLSKHGNFSHNVGVCVACGELGKRFRDKKKAAKEEAAKATLTGQDQFRKFTGAGLTPEEANRWIAKGLALMDCPICERKNVPERWSKEIAVDCCQMCQQEYMRSQEQGRWDKREETKVTKKIASSKSDRFKMTPEELDCAREGVETLCKLFAPEEKPSSKPPKHPMG
jgi:hypothetical protein